MEKIKIRGDELYEILVKIGKQQNPRDIFIPVDNARLVLPDFIIVEFSKSMAGGLYQIIFETPIGWKYVVEVDVKAKKTVGVSTLDLLQKEEQIKAITAAFEKGLKQVRQNIDTLQQSIVKEV